MKQLSDIFHNHTGRLAQKWSGYLPTYDQLLSPLRDQPIRLLEIGVMNGGSLEVWDAYFPQAAHIIGCDINEACARLRYDNARVQVVIGDANAPEIQARIRAQSEQLDIVIDDGSHCSADIIRSFVNYFPRLSNGGLYIIEDLHCSYWANYGGGLRHEYSTMAFFKQLVDILNQEHWLEGSKATEYLQAFAIYYGITLEASWLGEIQSIEFRNSMCILRKASPEACSLGVSQVRGQLAEVYEAIHKMDGIGVDELRRHGTLPARRHPLVVSLQRVRRAAGRVYRTFRPRQ